MGETQVIKKRRLGRTGLEVTPICFGTSGLGDMPSTYGYSVDEERGRATVRAILAGPVNFLDTSRNYAMGRSEQRIGAVIRELGGLPEGFVVSTKLDRDMETREFDAARARRIRRCRASGTRPPHWAAGSAPWSRPVSAPLSAASFTPSGTPTDTPRRR